MLSEKQLSKLKKLLIGQKRDLTGVISEKDEKVKSHYSLRDSVDALSTVDNHPAELATELYDREKDLALEVHSEDTISQVEAALERMEKGTYGVCATCKGEIPYDRLVAIPYTEYCIEHSVDKYIPSDRPVEEEVILPAVDNSFSGREANDSLQDDEDSFRLVAQYGNSDTPADFDGDYDHYNDLYKDENGNETYSDLDDLHVSQVDFLGGQISQAYADEARKHDYLDE